MINLTDFLKTKRYPGRFIVIGMDGDFSVALYGATGRSPSSLARHFVQKGTEVFMVAADDTVLREGNPELLEYPAVRIFENGIVVANGRQIEKLKILEDRAADSQLSTALAEEAYEPDEYKTPRITGCIIEGHDTTSSALHIARATSSDTERMAWEVPLGDGQGFFISTYTGEDIKPTPSFKGAPVSVGLQFGSADVAVRSVFDALVPSENDLDYRVGVVAVYRREGKTDLKIKNRLGNT
ncbi:hypothetical protein A2841_03070 [Candidatus Kaiserbacteria bacterium RIFCSPHIGHO2_01_FULL_48_10]|uniref:Inosine monophosphate cyclohydrolase-like domain-containing protein n=1 Tax=Candidatus Kaiserbacteria bacterium RIFCSPHIGHO2_01_FULL_48_10 TaxID=1798476 RepID=A0A1F6C4Q3_9BACT|nr:MAG: hypothetical protein A2841_03070 [Candidatus Kaiserbacteria bacterium RIFCSPHIGHO2_01_FULL_48_10]